MPVSAAPSRPPAADAGEEESFLRLANILLRQRRLILVLGLTGGIIGLAMGLTSTRQYRSTATFIPQSSESGLSGIALAAGQLGIRVPTSGGAWGPALYVEVLRSRALLERIARESVTVAELSGRRVPWFELLEIPDGSEERRLDRAVRALQSRISASEVKPLAGVRLAVRTPWPSVSKSLADRLVQRVNEFNVETRKSQAAAERQFVDQQSGEAEQRLREAEERWRLFRQANRVVGSPQLELESDRLQREVLLRQQLYSALLQSREEARIREVRDTPVITVIEEPRIAFEGEARGTVSKALLGGIAGGMIAIVIALVREGLGARRASGDPRAREFFELLDQAVPAVLKRRR